MRRHHASAAGGPTPAPSPAPSPAVDDPLRAHAAAMLSACREELTRADQKASFLLAGGGVAFGSLLSALFGHQWTPAGLDNRVEWLWWCGLVTAVIAVVALGDTLYPRTRTLSARTAGIAYYGDVLAVPRDQLPDEFRKAATYPEGYLLDQVVEISRIVGRKYRGIKLALWMFSTALASTLVAVLASSALR